MSTDERKEIDCREALKLIAAYVDKQSDDQDAQALEKHIESCVHCLDRVEFEKLMKTRLQGLKVDISTLNLSTKARRLLEDL